MLQHSTEGKVSARPQYNMLFPTRSTHNRLHSICNIFKQCFLYEHLRQTDYVPNTVPEFPSCFQSAKSPVEYRYFYQHCHTGFRRLLVACNGMPLQSLIRLPPYQPRPVSHTFSGTHTGKIICTRLYIITLQTVTGCILCYYEVCNL